MGLKLRLNGFRDVDAPDVFRALATFYGKRGASLVEEEDRQRRYDLYQRQGRWSVLDWDGGWEWKQRREAQLFVSKQLNATGLLVFVYDGDYWGYELFRSGEVVDQFVQSPDDAARWFPDQPCTGNAGALAREVGLPEAELVPYLVQRPPDGPSQALNDYARPGDVFRRFEECAVLDFLRAVGIAVELKEHHVRFCSAVWRSFRPRFP